MKKMEKTCWTAPISWHHKLAPAVTTRMFYFVVGPSSYHKNQKPSSAEARKRVSNRS
jgi:hypothetical protein